MKSLVSVADVHPANLRPIRRVVGLAPEAAVSHDRAADKPDANTAPAPTVTPVAVMAVMAADEMGTVMTAAEVAAATEMAAKSRCGRGGKRRGSESSGRRENEARLAEH
jgi:hypothetical protein